jgi:hypothetical protein
LGTFDAKEKHGKLGVLSSRLDKLGWTVMHPPISVLDLVRWAGGLVAVGIALVYAGYAPGAAPSVTSEELAFFESKVRPVLVEHCYACHSQEKGKAKGGFQLDTRAGVLKGGGRGPAVVAGKPDDSLLIKAIRYTDPDLSMPPKGKLAAGQIAALEAWVKRGAPDPRDEAGTAKAGIASDQSRAHWAFRPISRPRPPAVQGQSWPLGEVDQFLLARLEAAGITPAEDADRYTWLRRVSFDLTGLPPTPAQIAAFVQDRSPGAYEKVVDRLLASPAFGECWARHWLDLVGYADQVGTANDVPAVHAWRYRDYVIDALNQDKPFDRFIREQLAGDLLPFRSEQERRNQLVATGFLILGNLNVVEDDKAVLRWNVVDQQIEKVGKTFLALTLNCARCHDHKFDPVALTDYYALAGIFGSTESTYFTGRGVWSAPLAVDLPEPAADRQAREDVLRRHDALATRTRAERDEAVRKRDAAKLEKEKAALAAKIGALEQKLLHLDYIRPRASVAYAVREMAEPADARVTIRGNPHALGESVPRGFVRVATLGPAPAIPARQSGRLQLADWLVAPENPLTSRVTVNRIWAKLFGEGLVRSVDYFGRRGETPSHPELLDYLARRFVDGGWSQKKLIRELVLSRAYRMGGGSSATAAQIDPENRLLGRMSPRRLEAEAVRDAVLAVSGGLLPGGGPALPLEYAENVGGLDPKNVNPVSFTLKTFRDAQHRQRTVYLPVVRSSAQRGPAEVLNFFDFPQPAQFTGGRPVTTVATQALFLMNGPLLRAEAGRLAGELLKDGTDDRRRVQALYLRVLNRPASEEETREALDFLGSFRGRDQAREVWAGLCHALFACNEFLFRL